MVGTVGERLLGTRVSPQCVPVTFLPFSSLRWFCVQVKSPERHKTARVPMRVTFLSQYIRQYARNELQTLMFARQRISLGKGNILTKFGEKIHFAL